MNFIVETEREEDGRWIAEVLQLPGVLAYGQTPQEAQAKAQALALRVVAERLEHGEIAPEMISVSFQGSTLPVPVPRSNQISGPAQSPATGPQGESFDKRK